MTTFGHNSIPFIQSHFTNTLNFPILRGAFGAIFAQPIEEEKAFTTDPDLKLNSNGM